MNITRIFIKDTMCNADNTFVDEVQAAKARIAETLLKQLIKNPYLFTITTGDDGEVTVTLDINVVTPDDLARYTKRIDQVKQLVAML